MIVVIGVWAYGWVVMKQVTAHPGPLDFVALRSASATALLFGVMALRRQSLKPPPLGLTLAVGVSQTTAFQSLAQWALASGGAGRVSVLAYTMPFWSVLLAWWLLHERPGARQWLGIALAVAGLIFIIEPWQGLGSWQSAALAVTSGACWGLGTVLSKRMFELHRPSPLAFTAWQMLLGTLLLIVAAWLIPSRPIQWSGQMIYGLLYSAVLATSLAWTLWSFVVERLPTTVASLSALGVPIGAVLLSWALLHERPSAMERIGIVLIVLGLLVTSMAGARRTPMPDPPA
ncbi:DMT family transporter [Ottowia sp.]|uniref:DMT family transporter n=1 Tax=Ottowia sp. TaxID=1898956 RepID=UPI0025D8A725|nr:DMT family transporter [Ottowia sp.]